MAAMDKVRIDKWLWAARFFKTRSLATQEIDKGRVSVNGQVAKPAREVGAGDLVAIRQQSVTRTVQVRAVSANRGPAPTARLLYEETPESLKAGELAAIQRRLAAEPALSLEHGRPTKRERRDLDNATKGWDQRWSASIDD